jgi:hypothetical protein
MKITLNSNNEIHRKIAKLFVGCTDVDGDGLVGYCTCSRKFVFDIGCMEDRVILDLATAEPDLRLAIGEAMEFESGGRNVGSITHYFTQVNYEDSLCLSNFSGDLGVTDIQLSREWLESKNVEVSE